MRVLISGGRDYKNWAKFCRVLRRYELRYGPITLIIEGGASGADRFGRRWAKLYKIKCATYPADWNQYGKSAGYIRNSQMLKEGKPNAVIAFPTGGPGTKQMINLAKAEKRRAKLRLFVINCEV